MSGADAEAAVLTEQQGAVLLVTLNRPDALNAIDGAVTSGLLDAFARLDDDPQLSVGVVTGNGRGFCAGMDLKAFARAGTPVGLQDLYRRGAEKPLVGALEGFALGGGLELALLCDVLVAARGTKLGIPEVRVGLFAGGGGLLRLPDRLPRSLATEMAFTGVPITAEQAHAYGLVSRVTEPGGALAEALELAGTIGGNAPLALRASKAIIRASRGCSEEDYWGIQAPHVREVFRSEDAKEGSRAFAERRAPEWASR